MAWKRSAILLEILIAMTLLAIGLVGLMKGPIYLHRAQVRQFEKAECDRIATWTFTEIREQMATSQIGWAQIPALKKTSPQFQLPEALLNGRSIHREYTFTTLKEKRTQDNRIYRLVAVHIQVDRHTATYRVTVEKR